MASAFIADGYTADGYLAEERNNESVLWEAVRFKYRPAVPAEIEALRVLANANQMERKRSEFIANHLVEWDLKYPTPCVIGGKDVGGEVIPILADNCARLNRTFRDSLLQIIEGSRHSDDLPKIDLEAAAKNSLRG